MEFLVRTHSKLLQDLEFAVHHTEAPKNLENRNLFGMNNFVVFPKKIFTHTFSLASKVVQTMFFITFPLNQSQIFDKIEGVTFIPKISN